MLRLLLLATLFMPAVAFAGPLKDIGDAVTSTASKIGEGISDTVDAVKGDVDQDEIRREVDATTAATIKKLLAKDAKARALYDKSYGYAVFDSNTKSFLFTTSSGVGAAIEKNSGKKTYMRMFSGGVNVGAGLHFYQLIFFFENKASMDSFVNKGWAADAQGDAVMGKHALDGSARFVKGVAVYEISETGVMLGASIAGTKYWKDAQLNGNA